MSHQATSQLGFKTFFTLSSAAVRPRSVRLGSLVPFRVVAMGSKRLLSSSSKPESAAVENKRDKKLKGLTGTSSFAESVVVKENYGEVQSLETQSIKDDPTRIEAMTVQELRTMLRSAGVPARGRKCDLVSALKNFVDKQLDVNNVSEVTKVKKSKRTVAQSPSHRKPVRIDAEIITKKEEVSIQKDKFSVGKSSKLRRKISSSIDSEDAKADDLLTVPQAEPWTVLAHKKPQKGWIPYNPRTMRPLPLGRDTKFVKLMSWNVNGLRALMKLEGFSALELAQREDFDVLCLQETKLQEKDVDSIKECLIDGYENSFWTCSLSKLGYSGTAIVSRIKPLSITYGLGIPDHDTEGRIVTAEFDSFYLLSAYVPNSGDGLRRLSYRITQWDPALSNYMKELDKSKPVILTGDLNCAHQEIDIYNPAGNRRSAGFTDEERQSFGTNFLSKGFVDTFRRQHPDAVGYTYWGYRHGGRKANKGWRLDYFLVSESIAENVHDSYIAPEVAGSDHCPIGLILKL